VQPKQSLIGDASARVPDWGVPCAEPATHAAWARRTLARSGSVLRCPRMGTLVISEKPYGLKV